MRQQWIYAHRVWPLSDLIGGADRCLIVARYKSYSAATPLLWKCLMHRRTEKEQGYDSSVASSEEVERLDCNSGLLPSFKDLNEHCGDVQALQPSSTSG